MDNLTHLSRRERQIIDVLYARGQATVNEVRQDLPDPPTPMAVRRLIQILEEKGHVKRHKKGREFHFTPTQPRKSAGRTDLRRVLQTFFGGSLTEAFVSHLSDPKSSLSPQELDRLTQAIRDARKQGD